MIWAAQSQHLHVHLGKASLALFCPSAEGVGRWTWTAVSTPANHFLLPWAQGTVFTSACQQDPWTLAPSSQGHLQAPASLMASLPGTQSLGPSCREAARTRDAPAALPPAWPSGTWA